MDMKSVWINEAKGLDDADDLREFRERFAFPVLNGKRAIYLTGNSLGLQPKSAQIFVDEELEDWRTWGVEGHMHSRRPWYSYHHQFKEPLAQLVGAKPEEVVAMNSLTVNLHLMLASFYKPTSTRYKIIIAANEFPSDRYAVASQIKWHGFNPGDALIEVDATDDDEVLQHIHRHADSVALVLFSGVHFYSGRYFDLASIARVAHEVGAIVGFDLAHAIGNVELSLHNWNADFAVWCSYKYLNSGPGGVGGAFVHERHHSDTNLIRLAGWWGNDEDTRFDMQHDFIPVKGADSWQLSNAPVLAMAAHKAALDVFTEAGMQRISKKRDALTGFAENIILQIFNNNANVRILTPREKSRRGAQLSLQFDSNGREIFDTLMANNIIADWRNPDVIRIAPAPLYNTFADAATFGAILTDAMK